jgi:hypothetical protein
MRKPHMTTHYKNTTKKGLDAFLRNYGHYEVVRYDGSASRFIENEVRYIDPSLRASQLTHIIAKAFTIRNTGERRYLINDKAMHFRSNVRECQRRDMALEQGAKTVKRTRPMDPVERVLHDGFLRENIAFVDERDPRACRLDFYLPDFGIHVECKQFHSPRTNEQMKRVKDIIVIQGVAAAEAFVKMMAGHSTSNPADETHPDKVAQDMIALAKHRGYGVSLEGFELLNLNAEPPMVCRHKYEGTS